MIYNLIPTNEHERLHATKSYQILDTPKESQFDALVKLACQICDCKVSQINFVDADRQWNKATLPETPENLPRGSSFCSYTILEDEWMIVEDASSDPRFAQFPFVKDQPNVRFYAGVNVKSQNGYNIGTICVLDFEVKKLEDWQLESLKTLGKAVESLLEVRKKNIELERQTTFLENSADLTFRINPEDYTLSFINPKVEKILGFSAIEITGKPLNKVCKNLERIMVGINEWRNSGKNVFEGEFEFYSKNNELVWLSVKMTTKMGEWYGTAQNITERKVKDIQLAQSLKEKNVLLAEIHHRVKNNLAIISAMLELEVFNSENDSLKNILRNSQLRIHSMSRIHELLYHAGDFSEVPFSPFIQGLSDKLKGMFNLKAKSIVVETDVDEIRLSVSQAIPLALIVNELVTNSVKHAFKNKENGNIKIGFKVNEESLELSVEDNGIGLPNGFKTCQQDSIGFTLVNILSKQLDGSLSSKSENGTQFKLTLPLNTEENDRTWLTNEAIGF